MLLKFTLKIVKFIKAIAVSNLRPSFSMQWLLIDILIPSVYFKDQNWISKSVYCISSLMVCNIVFCSEFPDIPDIAGKVTRRRRRTQATAKRYACHANIIMFTSIVGNIVVVMRTVLTLLRKWKCVIFQQTTYGGRIITWHCTGP